MLAKPLHLGPLVVWLAIVILATACQTPVKTPTPNTAPPPAASPAPPPASQAKDAPTFRGTDLLSGKEVNFPAISSGRAVVLMFFSTG